KGTVMFPAVHFLLVSLLVSAPPLARAEKDPLDREGLAPIQEAARQLAREIEYLQEDIVTELEGQKERTLYRQADSVLVDSDQFQKSLKPGAVRKQLYKEFDGLDHKLHELLKAVQALGPEQRLLQRSAARVDTADEQPYARSARCRSAA